ncbi:MULTISPECIES: hypothetical protein [Streptomyces]|uniref:hypothetical protein n=1 Tax=Streptomyces TaxID=1883 RepID=UPI00084C1ED5|nr:MULTISPECIES: hypothetical protein [Streptomyces]TFI24050.1 hypothetical protein E4P36_24410 [Streptomyces sp. 4R-3d]
MRSGLLALRAAGLVAAMVAVPVLGTTAADAHDSVKATVSPSPVRPGGEVKIKVAGCENPRSASARSDVFVADSELAGRDGLRGEAKIKSSTEDGKYQVDVWCDGHDHRGAGVVEVNHKPKPEPKPSAKPTPSAKPKPKSSATPKPKSSAKPTPTSSAKPSAEPEKKAAASAPPSGTATHASESASASPVAPVRAGGGGRTSTTDMAADRAGPSTPHTVIGLVLAGVAAVAVAVRSARRKRSAARDSD